MAHSGQKAPGGWVAWRLACWGQEKRTGSSASLNSKVEVSIFTPEKSGEDGLGPGSLTQRVTLSAEVT